MAVEIRAATYASLRTALAAGTYQAGQMVFVEGRAAGGDGGQGMGQVVAIGSLVDDDDFILTGGSLAWKRGGVKPPDSNENVKLSRTDTIDSDAANSIILVSASDVYPSGIGDTTAPKGASGTNSDPLGSDADHGVPWIADSSYVSGAASVSSIVGGYDHRVNQVAGTAIGGGHNYIQYNINGHSAIVGGSNNRISGGRAAIIGGRNCTISGDNNFAVIAGGDKNLIKDDSDYAGVLSGFGNYIENGDYSVVIGGRSTRVADSDYAASISGLNSTITGSAYAALIGGANNSITNTSPYSAIVGGSANRVDAARYAVVIGGEDGVAFDDGMVVQGGSSLTEAGDVQSVRFVWGLRTTDATLTNMAGPNSALLTLGNAHTTLLTGRIHLSALDESTGNSASYVHEFSAKWDGTTGTIIDAGGSGATRNFTQIHDNIGVAALPHMASNTGAIRPKVTGKAATNIKWSAAFDGVMTRF